MSTNVIVTVKSWNLSNFQQLKEQDSENNWHLITEKTELNFEKLKELNPQYIFFPHWSWLIPPEIYENFSCVVFHMTDLPFGRGGSPLQNLISRGIYQTKISALKVAKGMDTGDIYCQEPLSLKQGNAEEIFKKCSQIIFTKMIPFIISNNPQPKKQEGSIVEFKRRTPGQSDLLNNNLDNLPKIYDHIRMLDGEGYPPAFLEKNQLHLEFDQAQLKDDCVEARVKIKLKSAFSTSVSPGGKSVISSGLEKAGSENRPSPKGEACHRSIDRWCRFSLTMN